MDLGEGQKDMGSGAQPNVWDQNVISKEGVKGGKNGNLGPQGLLFNLI